MGKKRAGLCLMPYCRHRAAPGRRICHRCRSRIYREKHPLTAAYHQVKSHARERRIEFTLTKEEFFLLCRLTGYHLRRGRLQFSLTLDRVNSERGYSWDNVTVLTHADNSLKQDRFERGVKPLRCTRDWFQPAPAVLA